MILLLVRSLAVVVAAATASAALAAVLGAHAAARRPAGVPEPVRGVYLGAYVAYGSRWTDSAQALRTMTRFEAQIGTSLAIDNRFYGWSEPFPTDLQRADVVAGRIPMITWKGPRLEAILNGSQDTLIAERAQAVRSFGTPIFVRWGWEMNGNWTEWSGAANATPGTHDGPRKYVQAWRRIHDLFARAGATNVSWVWAPNARSVPETRWNAIASYYPGDAYVDWVGFSAYNWGRRHWWSRWTSFASLVGPIYRTWSGRKPMMVAETSTVGDTAAKARWIAAIVPALERSFPRIKALVWFQKPPRWDVTRPASSLTALRSLARARLFARSG